MMEHIKNIAQLQALAEKHIAEDYFHYLEGGADDQRTLSRNITAFQSIQIRPRRLVDVREVDTSVQILGQDLPSPIILAPVGWQGYFHSDGEIATARAAQSTGHLMIASTVSVHPYSDIAKELERKPWFQLYPTTDRRITKLLLKKAEDEGCTVVVLTIDLPVAGNREKHIRTLTQGLKNEQKQTGNLRGLLKEGETPWDSSMTWDIIAWLSANTQMKIVLKGILTHEDASLAVKYGADAIIVSNHGGRQLESDLATIEALSEITDAITGKIPVLFDGGIRRGTDILKALAIGADAVCIGRAYCYGLGAGGQAGVERAIQILQEELVRNMKLTGVTSIQQLNRNYVRLGMFK